jgi:glycosyltransferase involved in cell wall biosynthesis
VIDVVMPARDEAPTVARNVAAARACAFVREVIVVDDGSSDATADEAASAGAKVVRRDGADGSKALAMAAGVAATDADAILFVDADCTGLTGAHLDAIVRPFLDGSAVMSIGAFDYGWFWNPMVVRWPPLSGERIIPRWVFEAIPESKLAGYTIEVRINQVIAERHLPTTVQTMRGVSHRTKRDKHGPVEGYRRTYWMYRELLRMLRPVGDVRWRTYWYYLRNLTVLRSARAATPRAPAS